MIYFQCQNFLVAILNINTTDLSDHDTLLNRIGVPGKDGWKDKLCYTPLTDRMQNG